MRELGVKGPAMLDIACDSVDFRSRRQPSSRTAAASNNSDGNIPKKATWSFPNKMLWVGKRR